jgi:3-hydroxyisobutyrate dehydrogenase-like beta-hydroxyacid dehydrogenase
MKGINPGAIFVDMTTSEPSLAIEIAQAAAEKVIVLASILVIQFVRFVYT